MKSTWIKKRLTDVAWFQRGYDLPKKKMQPGKYPVLGSASIIGSHNEYKVGGPGVVTGRSGTLGVVQYVKTNFWPHNTSLWVKDFKGNNEQFIYYLLCCIDFENFNSGGAVPSLNRNVLGAFLVDLPPLEEQKKIAGILSAYDELIENYLKRIKLLEEKAQLIYENWQDSVEEKVPIHDLISSFINGGWGKEQAVGNYVVEAAVIRGTDMPRCNRGSYAKVPIRFHTKSNWDSRQLASGDVIMEMSNGNASNIGRTILIDDWTLEVFRGKPICASFCKRVSPVQPEFGVYLHRHFSWMKLTGQVDTYVKQAANGINNFDFDRMIQNEEIGVPTHEKAAVLIRQLGAINDLQSNLRQGVSSLEEVRNILLPRLITGIIDVEELEVQMPLNA